MHGFKGWLMAGLCCGFASLAQAGTLSLTGEGSVQYTPDSARLSFTAVGRGATSAKARQALNQSMSQWDSRIKDLRSKLSDYKDAMLTVYSINQPEPDHPKQQHRIKVASQQISFTLHHLQLLDTVLAAADASNLQYHLNSGDFFASSDRELKQKALAAAIADARSQCQFIAKQLNQHCGDVHSMQVNQASPGPRPMMLEARAKGPSPLTVGQETLRANVQVTFELH